MGTDVLDRPDTTTKDTTDEGHLSHIVFSPDPKEDAIAYVFRARLEGFEVTALCGFKFVPQRDPKKYPMCQKCKEIRENARPDEPIEGIRS